MAAVKFNHVLKNLTWCHAVTIDHVAMTRAKNRKAFRTFRLSPLLSELIGIRRRYYSDIAGTIFQAAAKLKQ